MNSYCHRLLHCFFLLLSLFAILLAGTGRHNCGAHAVKCLPDQRASLLDLKHGFRFEENSSKPLVSWKPGSNCCSWEGVTCDTEYGHIIGLDLSERYMLCNLSSSLFNLTSLQTLNLAWNYFVGVPMPLLGFEKLTKLTHLNLSNTGFFGQIPIGISHLTRLVSLDLSNTYFGQALELYDPNLQTLPRNLTNLKELRLDSTDISYDAKWIRTLTTSVPQLQVLSLGDCNLPGMLTKDIFQLKNLRVLDLSENYMLSGVLPEFLKNNTLESLVISGTHISGNLPESIGNLKKLTKLEISRNTMLTGVIPSSIGNLTQLVLLDLSSNYFSGVIPFSIGKLARLKHLYLSGNNLGGGIPLSIGNLTRLENLYLNSNNLNGVIPSSLGKLAQLVYVDLSGNHLSGPLPSFVPWASIARLVLSYNDFRGPIPSSYGFRHLDTLDLSFNSLSGSIPAHLFCLPELQDLYLGHNQLSGQVGECLNTSNLLRGIDMSYNQFQGPLPTFLYKLSGLQFLDIAANNFIVELDMFENLTNLHHLDLSNNRLSIRDTKGNYSGSFPNLNRLRMASCNLTKIPAFLLCLPELQHLYLGHNQLSGQVGECLNTSNLLRDIDMSYNQFQGPLPTFLYKLSGLQFLDIAANNFILELAMFENLTNLYDLDLSNNRLSIRDTKGNYSGSFPQLDSLRMASCNLTKIPAFLRYQEAMTDLDISDNIIGGHIPKWIWSIGNGSLWRLNLSHNLFTYVEGQTNLSFSSNMRSIDLQYNMLQGPIPLPSAPALSIYDLDYSHNKFSSIIPPNISYHFPLIYSFVLANNYLTGNIPMSLCQVGSNVLDISNNFLSGSIPQCLLDGDTNLSLLNLRGNELQGTIPQNINERCPLETIILSDNLLEGRLPRSLANCSNLEVLEVGNNSIVDSFPFWLGNIVNLKVLILRTNGFYGQIGPPQNDEANYTFPALQILDLSSNNFSGNLSSKFLSNLEVMKNSSQLKYSTAGLSYYMNYSTSYQDAISVTIKGHKFTLVSELTIFLSLDFSDNGFEGDIPEVIGELHGLVALNFSRNAFTGKIPPSIGNLIQLESLDLSKNHLSGEIPQEMTSLTFLAYLDLSNNNLSGKIPQTNQFSTFPNTSFEGNQGLCGIPLSKQCGNASQNGTNTVPSSESSHSPSTYVIGLALSVGLGFGVGMAAVLVLQNVPWNFLKKKHGNQPQP